VDPTMVEMQMIYQAEFISIVFRQEILYKRGRCCYLNKKEPTFPPFVKREDEGGVMKQFIRRKI